MQLNECYIISINHDPGLIMNCQISYCRIFVGWSGVRVSLITFFNSRCQELGKNPAPLHAFCPFPERHLSAGKRMPNRMDCHLFRNARLTFHSECVFKTQKVLFDLPVPCMVLSKSQKGRGQESTGYNQDPLTVPFAFWPHLLKIETGGGGLFLHWCGEIGPHIC